MKAQLRLSGATVAFVLLAVSSPPVVLGQDVPELVGQWSFGPTAASAYSDDHLYFGSGATLIVAEVSDPSALQLESETQLPGLVRGVVLNGGYAYVALENGGFSE